jgi:hypothetical protein
MGKIKMGCYFRKIEKSMDQLGAQHGEIIVKKYLFMHQRTNGRSSSGCFKISSSFPMVYSIDRLSFVQSISSNCRSNLKSYQFYRNCRALCRFANLMYSVASITKRLKCSTFGVAALTLFQIY